MCIANDFHAFVELPEGIRGKQYRERIGLSRGYWAFVPFYLRAPARGSRVFHDQRVRSRVAKPEHGTLCFRVRKSPEINAIL